MLTEINRNSLPGMGIEKIVLPEKGIQDAFKIERGDALGVGRNIRKRRPRYFLRMRRMTGNQKGDDQGDSYPHSRPWKSLKKRLRSTVVATSTETLFRSGFWRKSATVIPRVNAPAHS